MCAPPVTLSTQYESCACTVLSLVLRLVVKCDAALKAVAETCDTLLFNPGFSGLVQGCPPWRQLQLFGRSLLAGARRPSGFWAAVVLLLDSTGMMHVMSRSALFGCGWQQR
jgi:hypothetical protein